MGGGQLDTVVVARGSEEQVPHGGGANSCSETSAVCVLGVIKQGFLEEVAFEVGLEGSEWL